MAVAVAVSLVSLPAVVPLDGSPAVVALDGSAGGRSARLFGVAGSGAGRSARLPGRALRASTGAAGLDKPRSSRVGAAFDGLSRDGRFGGVGGAGRPLSDAEMAGSRTMLATGTEPTSGRSATVTGGITGAG